MVEAAIVLPLVILILVSFVGITAHFYKCLRAQNELQQQLLRRSIRQTPY